MRATEAAHARPPAAAPPMPEPAPVTVPVVAAGELLRGARGEVAAGLKQVDAELRRRGMPRLSLEGQLIRPLLCRAAGTALGHPLDARFWRAAAAIQLAHEASLVHDDIVDGAATRRGAPTVASSRGVAAALIHGDHLLTAAYRVAAWTESQAFIGRFADSVERTVAAELEQGRRRNATLERSTYRNIVLGKSGELLGCALATSALLHQPALAPRLGELGRQLGLAYQMLDDLLDYCPAAATGKPPYADHRRGHWTWLLDFCPDHSFDASPDRLHSCMHGGGDSPMRRALLHYHQVCEELTAEIRTVLPADTLLPALLAHWSERAADAVAIEAAAISPQSTPGTAGLVLPGGDEWLGSMRRHGRTFRFASRLFPVAARQKVEHVYAYCRFTDDLADGDDARDVSAALARLDAWHALSRQAFSGTSTGYPALDAAMQDMAEAGVPFDCAAELIEGMRMDLRGRRYRTLDELHVYAHRVAGVVGIWLTRLFGVHEPAVLDRAAAMGAAMQLTNIARDVGEDLDAGRLYLPGEWLAAAGLDEAALRQMRDAKRVDVEYAAVIERLLLHAEAAYDHAFEAVPALPPFFQRPVAVAAHAYRGIHAQIRRNRYDNLNRRAATSGADKLRHAVHAGMHLRRARGRWRASPLTAVIAVALACAMPVDTSAQSAACAPPTTPAQHLAAAQARLAADVSDATLLDVVRAHYFVAVDDADSIDAGLAVLDRATKTFAAAHSATGVAGRNSPDMERREDSGTAALHTAYRGALTALRAKHGRWPPQRLRDTRRGLAWLDEAVVTHPDNYEVRYLRLVTGYYLPALFGRRGEVTEDLNALRALLPDVPVHQRDSLFDTVVRFISVAGGTTDAEAASRVQIEPPLPRTAVRCGGGEGVTP